MKCKPKKNDSIAYGATTLTPCNIFFDARQIWNYSYIGNYLVELWRDNVSIRMEKEVFEKHFRGCE